MSFAKKLVTSAALVALQQNDALFTKSFLTPQKEVTPTFDPELLYVECQRCSAPVLWDKGKTTQLLQAAKIKATSIDAHCLIVSEGCPICMPHARDGFLLSVVRMAALTPEEANHMMRKAGNA